MDGFRLFLALVIVYIMPVVITFWLVIHSMSVTWRRLNPRFAYLAAGACIFLVVVTCALFQPVLLGNDLGLNPVLFGLGAIIYLASWGLWKPVKQYLDFRTFAGVPEVTNEKITLITDGPFAMVRHPRYFMVAIGVVGWCLMANYSGAYLVGIASLLGLVLVVTLEERDLVVRFGDEYRQYQERVPRLFPTISGLRQFLKETFSGKPA